MTHDDPGYRDEFIVGSFESDGKILSIDVYGKNYRYEPYMFVYDADGIINVSISICECKYISDEKLTDDQVKDFDNFMNLISPDSKCYKSMWDKAVFCWNAADDNDIRIDIDRVNQPDYSQLNN